jgi:hypothetical protein
MGSFYIIAIYINLLEFRHIANLAAREDGNYSPYSGKAFALSKFKNSITVENNTEKPNLFP